MANFARGDGLDVGAVRQAGRDLKEMAGKYQEIAIDAGLAVAGAVPGVGWGADAISLGRSISKGDGWGALFDVIGFVPLLGDAAKGGRILNKALALRRVLDQSLTGLARTLTKTQDTAAAFWRSRGNSAAYREALQSCSSPKCFNDAARLKGPQYGNTPTSGGNWGSQAGRGDSAWTPDPGTSLDTFLKDSGTGATSIRYDNGFPDFSPFSKGDVQIPMTGNHNADFGLADDLFRKQLDDPNWARPDGMTWHHLQDGATMQLVPSALNSNAGHMGGAALFKEGRAVGDDF